MESKTNAEQVKIYFCVPRCFVKGIRINVKSKIKNLLKLLTNKLEYIFAFNGNIIDSNLSFESIGAKNGNVIIAFPKNQERLNLLENRWIDLTKDELFQCKLYNMSNCATNKEYCRLKDMKTLKMEGSLKLYRNFSRKFASKKRKEADSLLDIESVINYEPLTEPCTEAMPVLW